MKECEIWNKKGSGFEFQLLRLWAVANHVTPLILLPPSTRRGGTSLQGRPCPRSLDLSPTPAPGGREGPALPCGPLPTPRTVPAHHCARSHPRGLVSAQRRFLRSRRALLPCACAALAVAPGEGGGQGAPVAPAGAAAPLGLQRADPSPAARSRHRSRSAPPGGC